MALDCRLVHEHFFQEPWQATSAHLVCGIVFEVGDWAVTQCQTPSPLEEGWSGSVLLVVLPLPIVLYMPGCIPFLFLEIQLFPAHVAWSPHLYLHHCVQVSSQRPDRCLDHLL